MRIIELKGSLDALVLASVGLTISACNMSKAAVDACRKLGIAEQTYYRWKKEYGGLRVDPSKRLKGLEQENARRKRLVADLSLDTSLLKEVAAGNF